MKDFWDGFEKQAKSSWWLKIPGVAKYQQIANSPTFKAKKMIGSGLVASGGLGYAAHQLTKEPDTIQEMMAQQQQ